MNKTVTLSARISQEDAEFISQLNIADAKTPSDKLRALVSEARRRSLHEEDFRGHLKMFQDMIGPVKANISETELAQNIHSEVVSRTLDWIPDMMAFVLSTTATKEEGMSKEQLTLLEAGLTERIFRLLDATTQLALTNPSPCYRPSVIQDRAQSLISLLSLINHVSSHSSHHKEEL